VVLSVPLLPFAVVVVVVAAGAAFLLALLLVLLLFFLSVCWNGAETAVVASSLRRFRYSRRFKR